MKQLLLLSLGLILFLSSCEKKSIEEPEPEPITELEISPDLAEKWSSMTLNTIKISPQNSPTYASRSLGYMGLTMYESVVNGSILYKSIAPELNGLGALPVKENIKDTDWELALNAGQSFMLKSLYPHAPTYIFMQIDSLYEGVISEKRAAGIPDSVILSSTAYGKSIAEAIWEWAKTDGGDMAYLRTFDFSYAYPRGPHMWFPPIAGQSSVVAPMHPTWGSNRTFVKANSELPVPQINEVSLDTSSVYYKDMKLVYDTFNTLTKEQKESALWWGDDPSASASPPGHSYYLANKLVHALKPNLFEATSVYAKVGMSVADAFINCFKCKYTYHSERPRNYIVRVIDSRFNQFWPEPPFPAFTSGHSTQAAAAATSLISVFGNDVKVEDDFHKGRPKDLIRNTEFVERSFDHIWDFAEECGYSRIYGGIHTPQDNKMGLEEGKKIGTIISNLSWRSPEL